MTNGEKIYTVEVDGGFYQFKLYQAMENKGVSHNKFMRDTETAYTVMRRYARGTVQRADLLLVAKWCKYLDCELTDIIEYTRR